MNPKINSPGIDTKWVMNVIGPAGSWKCVEDVIGCVLVPSDPLAGTLLG